MTLYRITFEVIQEPLIERGQPAYCSDKKIIHTDEQKYNVLREFAIALEDEL
jgi:hypothetical protein